MIHTIIELGTGKIKVGPAICGGRLGVAFRVLEGSHNPGDQVGGEPDFFPHVIIYIDSLESGRVLQDVVNYVCWKLDDARKKKERKETL